MTESKIAEYQHGFRGNRRIMDAIHIVHYLLNKLWLLQKRFEGFQRGKLKVALKKLLISNVNKRHNAIKQTRPERQIREVNRVSSTLLHY